MRPHSTVILAPAGIQLGKTPQAPQAVIHPQNQPSQLNQPEMDPGAALGRDDKMVRTPKDHVELQ